MLRHGLFTGNKKVNAVFLKPVILIKYTLHHIYVYLSLSLSCVYPYLYVCICVYTSVHISPPFCSFLSSLSFSLHARLFRTSELSNRAGPDDGFWSHWSNFRYIADVVTDKAVRITHFSYYSKCRVEVGGNHDIMQTRNHKSYLFIWYLLFCFLLFSLCDCYELLYFLTFWTSFLSRSHQKCMSECDMSQIISINYFLIIF